MKLVKSLLLGSAAGIAAVAGAQAADLPSRKAAPVEYVRVCSAYGVGFFFIPGTDTCLRVSGRVRAEYSIGDRYGENLDAYGSRARGRLNLDARTATAYGPLRTYLRFELTNSTGFYNGTVGGNQGLVFPGSARSNVAPTTPGTLTANATASLVDMAFVQFGPITAGRAQSFFDFYANDYGFSTVRTADSRLNLLAYTATFGSGFSVSLSLEDRISGTGARENSAASRTTGAALTVAGQDFPDVVASVRVDQGWGSAQLSGALTQRSVVSAAASTAFALSATTGLVAPTVTPAVTGGDELGFAIQGGVKINLPFLAAGDVFWLQAAYADGAMGYLGYGAGGISRLGSITVPDIGVNPVTGSIKNTTGFSVVAAFRHFWTPQLRSEIYGSYAQLELGSIAPLATYATGAIVRPLNPREAIVAGNLIWTPVSGLDIGVEVIYSHVDLRSRVGTVNNAGARLAGIGIKSDDAFAGRLRIQRDF